MNDALKLQISAFIDGELPDNETELLLRRLSQDVELRAQAAQYLSIGRAIRGDLELENMSRLRARVAAALGEDIVETETVAEMVPGRFMRPVVGVAVAASVAVMALIGLRQLGPAEELPLQSIDDLAALAIDVAPSYTEPPANEFMSNRPSDMLRRYYLRHGQRSADIGSRLVGLELRGDELVSVSEPDAATPDDEAVSSSPQPVSSPPGEAQ